MDKIISQKNNIATGPRKLEQPGFTDIPDHGKATAPLPAVHHGMPNYGKRGRVIVFIDGANLFYAAAQLCIEVDYAKLLHYLTAQDNLVHVFFYTGCDPDNERQHGFLRWMGHNGFRVVTKNLEPCSRNGKKANLDVEIAVDMMNLSPYCDTAVLVSGDGDFAYVVNAIAARGVRVEIVGLRSMTNSTLIAAADCYVDLAEIQQIFQKFDGFCGVQQAAGDLNIY